MDSDSADVRVKKKDCIERNYKVFILNIRNIFVTLQMSSACAEAVARQPMPTI